MLTKRFAAIAAITTACATTQLQANQSICVFDPLGSSGEIYAVMKDYALASKRWGVNVTLKSYTEERVATEDFKAGQCDGLYVTGMRGRTFNSFTGSLDALGAIPSNAAARAVLQLMARPQLAADMVENGYEVAGILSLGTAYLFVRDSNIDTLAEAAGKKIAVISHDQAQLKMAQRVGTQPVMAEINTFAGMFNNGQVDIVGAPAMVFRPFELQKGLGTKGAIIRFPILHVSMNLIIRQHKFPTGYGQKSREWMATQIPRTMDFVDRMEKDIPARYWKDVPPNDHVGYVKLIRETRIDLTKSGYYSPKMMKLLKRLRCLQVPNSFECSLNDE